MHKLKAFGLFLPCTSKYLSGIAIDGQYTSLIEEKHNMHEKLQNISNLGWDLVHMIEVINEIMSMFKTWNNLDHLMKQINITFDQLTLLTNILENDSWINNVSVRT